MQIKRKVSKADKAIKQQAQARTPLIDSMMPWQDRPKSDGRYYSGISEEKAFRLSDRIHNELRSGQLEGQALFDRLRDDMNLDINNPEHRKQIKDIQQWAQYRGRNSEFSKTRSYGVPNADAQEGMWAGIFTHSGNPSEQLNIGGDQHSTDTGFTGGKYKGENADIQNSLRPDGRLNIGVVGAPAQQYNPNGLGSHVVSQADDSWTLRNLVDEYKSTVIEEGGLFGDGKLLQSDGAGINTRPDGHMRDPNTKGRYTKRFLAGSAHPPGTVRNQTSMPGYKGGSALSNPYNPQMGSKNYVTDLQQLGGNIMDKPLKDLRKEGIWLPKPEFKSNDLSISVPMSTAERLGGGIQVRKDLLDPEVMKEVQALSERFNGREFRAEGLPGVGDAVDGLKKNWRGGVGASLVNGASRELGKKVAQGDWKGAIAEFGMTYGGGAMLESGLKGVANNGVVKQVASAVGKRLPGVGARFAGGTAGSGGLLAPVLGTIGALEVADGLVEGFTGKGTLDHAADNVRDTYTRTTGDKRSDEQIATAMTPQGVYKPEQVGGPKLTQDKISDISVSLEKSTGVAPTPVQEAQVGVSTPQVKAQNNLMGWIKKINPWK